MSSDMGSPGALSLLELNDDERAQFVDYLYKTKPELNPDLLEVIFGGKVLMVLDAFAGSTVKYPTREFLEKTISYVKIYTYCKTRGFTEEAYELAGKVFKRRKVSIVRIVDKVRQVLEEDL